MQSVMTNRFRAAADIETQRSSFDRSFGYKTTFHGGWLIPIFVDEALPGDTFNLNMTGFARLATPIHPVMDNMTMETFFFSVPNRLLWRNWEKFMGAKDNPGDTTEYTLPQLFLPQGTQPHQLADYFGLPPWPIGTNPSVSALPFRAYNLIFNQWFRDQNLIDSAYFSDDDGPELNTAGQEYFKHRRGKRHDYFTSCLPWPQKGAEVTIPTGPPLAPVYPVTGDNQFTDPFLTQTNLSSHVEWFGGVATSTTGVELVADLNSAFTSTINDLRAAFQIQKLLERDARGGTRYTEIIKSHFGVNSPDQRLQRAEYLGGGSSPVQIMPIAQTSQSTIDSPQGNLSAMGTASLRGHGFTKSFTEHSTLIGLINVRADLTYQKGLERMWTRTTKLDFYWPSLAHLGEQAVYSKEIYSDGSVNDDDVFGYQERYAEYRYKPSKITGLFRSDAALSLDAWHLSEDFTTRPVLDEQFIRDSPPIDRILAVPTEPHFIFDAYFKLRCSRPMPLYSIPGMIDHF